MEKLGEMLGRWLRHAERLFHTLVGLIFLVLTVAGAGVAFAEWQDYQRSPSVGSFRFWLLAGFTGLLFIFCLYSFLKARSVR